MNTNPAKILVFNMNCRGKDIYTWDYKKDSSQNKTWEVVILLTLVDKRLGFSDEMIYDELIQ